MNYVDSSEEESDSNVLETCWKWRFPRFTPTPSAIGFTQLNHSSAQSDEESTESTVLPSTTPTTRNSYNSTTYTFSDKTEKENVNETNPKYELRTRPRSVGDISDSFCNNHTRTHTNEDSSNVINNSVASTVNIIEDQSVGRVSSPSDSIINPAPLNSSSSGGGFLSFFGARFNKSGTRHLERNSSAQNSSVDSSTEKNSNRNSINENRYTKFPLSSTSSRPSANSSSNTSQVLPRSNTIVADIGISTAHTGSSSSSNTESKSKQPQLKSKSKSDNNLNQRIKINNNSSLQNSSGALSNSNNKTLHSNRDTKKLNSVQLGDHATIRLPWTPIQRQNNLSSVIPSNRNIPNTHTNIDFNKSSVRYIDTDFWGSHSQTHHHLPATACNTTNHRLSRKQADSYSKRRSRSLERASTFRVVQGNVSNVGFTQGFSQNLGCSNSLERNRHSKIKEGLSSAEEDILLRNITQNNSIVRNSSTKSAGTASQRAKPHHHQHIILGNSRSNELKIHESLRISKSESTQKAKPPLLGKIHASSEPNSSFSSCDSSTSSFDIVNRNREFASSSAPPSPPPRPLCTLRPNKSRPVASSFSFSSADKPPPVDRALKRKVPAFTKSAPSMNSTSNMNAPINRRPAPTLTHDSIDSTSIPDTSRILSSSSHSEQEIVPASTNITSVPSAMSSVEDARNSGFINKPTKGWLHSDQLLTKEGVQYTIRYVGCLDVNTSMKSLDFDTRSLIAKECINQICEAAGLKSVDRKRRTDRRLVRLLGLRPRLEHAGSDVHLTITSTCLKLTSLDTGAIIAVHEMPNISFASGGDSTMLDFVAYVAKDSIVGRACFVLECGSGLAQDVITTVGQAFELRFKEYLQKRPQIPISRLADDDPEYYNDLPGKIPPESSVSAQKDKDTNTTYAKSDKVNKSKEPPRLTLPEQSELSVNLIDFEAPTPPAFGPTVRDKALASLLLDGNSSPTSSSAHEKPSLPTSQNDPFDMPAFEASLNSNDVPLAPAEQKSQLESETWFHGLISRSEAEALVVDDGDFLVRESQTTPGQYVLTGIQNGSAKHLLLVDPKGIVRTKDRTFDSVTHLIRHHCDNHCPIISAESVVLLINPVLNNKAISSTLISPPQK